MRWGTYAKMASGVLSSKNEIRSVLVDPRILVIRNLAAESRRLMEKFYRDDTFWHKLHELQSVLGPLADATVKIQGVLFSFMLKLDQESW